MTALRGRRKVGIAVAGLGNVGFETVRLLRHNRRSYAARAGAEIELRAVCDRRAGEKARRLRLPSSVRRVRDWRALLRDPGVDAVVELFGGVRDARRLVLGALASGRHVVTANKHLLSMHWPGILSAARARGRRVRFEAAVAGGIPIVQAVRTGLAANRVDSVSGILNGTTNYILTRMVHARCELDEALREAQRLGMAEADPAYDLSGLDTAHKISILASMITGAWVRPDRIPRQGILALDLEDLLFAVEKLGRTARLVGTAAFRWERRPLGVEAHVQPVLVPLKHPLAAVHGGYNAVLADTSSAEDLMFYGLGAGPGPAASAVISDILELGGDILAGGPERGAPTVRRGAAALVEESPAPYYLKFRVRDVPGVLARITDLLGRSGISIAQVHQSGKGRVVPVMFVTHATARRRIDRARRAIVRLATVNRRHSCIRILP